VVLALTTDEPTVHAVRQHVVRRVSRQSGRDVLTANIGHLDGCFKDVAMRLGIPRLSGDPAGAARQLAEASDGAVVVMDGNVVEGSWDAQVLGKMSREQTRGLFLVVSEEMGSGVGSNPGHDRVEIRGESKDTARVWWEGVIEALVEAGPPGSLASLERWWRGMGGLASQLEGGAAESSLDESALLLLGCLVLSRRSWPAAQIEALGTRRDLDALLQAGLLRMERGFYVVDRPGRVVPASSAGVGERVARAMLEAFADDPWGCLRASLLMLDAGLSSEAGEHLAEALERAASISQRRDLWSIWMSELGERDPESHRELALHSAQRALAFDDVDAALELAGEAQRGLSTASYEACLVMGRAQLARGDIVGARVSLGKSRDMAVDEVSRAEPWASEAEAAFWAGELDLAFELANKALSCGPGPSAKLRARNVTGRVLLARAQWAEAEASFAEDEALASSERLLDALSRARVNRAIALLSHGQLDAAKRVLAGVLEEGRRQRHPRAIAIALSNLGVVEHLDGRYAQALELYQQAIDACHELGDRLGLARPAANLAELRLELGMVEEAEQALRFAQCTLSAGVPASISPLLSVLEAEIHLERGDSVQASRCARDALHNASRSSNGAKVGECCRLLARIALEDGNLAAAEDAIARSQLHAESERAEAECAWLEALLARAKGDDAADLAQRASTLARACGDRELRRATAMLESEIALSDEDLRAAGIHLRSAQRVLREMTDGLPVSLVRSVHSRREIRSMEALAFAIEQRKGSTSQAPASDREGARAVTGGFLGNDPKVRRLLAMVQRVSANSHAPVLIHGESGTGKELVAEAIHGFGDRRDKPLVKVNCSALVETLLLSELFGHEKGAFTGASARRRGRFELADGGVLFLDEIGDISARTQVALLRVLQDGTFERVGGGAPLKTDVRVVCATHRDLSRMVAEGKFREDLYYRLCGVVLEVPALRERGQDLMLLANHFLQEIAKERREPVKSLTSEAFDVLSHHGWPGNVRELQNVLRASTLFADGLLIGPEVVRDQIHTPGCEEEAAEACAPSRSCPAPRSSHPSDPSELAFERIRQGDASLTEMKRRIERECIMRALNETGGNITRAATMLGMKRPRLSQIIKELGLQKGEG
jgi:transcriptional regulator with GAF, ATPase, and Fis domain/tetratricopeptide (TPR) repeat protein